MPHFSAKSIERLSTCHSDLQRLFNRVIEETDIVILEGHRGKQAQDAAYAAGRSRVKWPHGNHNAIPSRAVDVAPYPVNWTDLKRFRDLAVIVKRLAKELGLRVVWGGDWTSLVDMPHWELAK